MFDFIITQRDEKTMARTGMLTTPHGSIATPAFIFCGTKGAIKGATPSQMRACNTQIMLANTYHLMLQPTAARVRALGGLHKLMGWDGPLLTDSGGFQIFSLGHGVGADEINSRREIKGSRDSQRPTLLLKIDETGATFRSYLDGSLHQLTAESAIAIQRDLGADLVVVFDECPPLSFTRDEMAASMERSHRWESRSLAEFARHDDGTQALYGIVHGGTHRDLREQSADFTESQNFFGTAIGGCLGESKAELYDIVSWVTPRLHKTRPRHLLGIGGVEDIWRGVALGIDTFDCVHPTRLARHGGALVRAAGETGKGVDRGKINLRNSMYKDDTQPIETDCPCPTCQQFSRGTLHHLLKAGEMVAVTYLVQHNVYFMNALLTAVRQSIRTNRFSETMQEWLAGRP